MTTYVYRGTTPEPKLIPRRPPATCGTDSGYYRHLRTTKTPPCDACLREHARVTAERAARNRAAWLAER